MDAIEDRSEALRASQEACYESLIPKHTYTIALGLSSHIGYSLKDGHGVHEGQHIWQCERCGRIMSVTTIPFVVVS